LAAKIPNRNTENCIDLILSVTMRQSRTANAGKVVVGGLHGGWIFEVI
jgi:hypothetical protein